MTHLPATLHSFFAILAGFVTMTVLITAATLLLRRVSPSMANPDQRADRTAALANLALSLVFGMCGGYTTAVVAGAHNTIFYVMALAMVVLVLGALSSVQMRGRQGALYLLLLTALPPLAVMTGGLLRMRQTGVY